VNPVRAEMVKEPEDYPWSGHRVYLGLETIPWLTTEWVLSQFSGRLATARRAYKRFVMDGKGNGRQEEYHRGSESDGRILGDDTFIDRVLEEKQTKPRLKTNLSRVIKQVCGRYSVKERELGIRGKDRRLAEMRAMIAWLIMELEVSTLSELGKLTGRDITTLSSAVKRLQIRAKMDLELTERMKELREVFS
jgi:hypothetical protein